MSHKSIFGSNHARTYGDIYIIVLTSNDVIGDNKIYVFRLVLTRNKRCNVFVKRITHTYIYILIYRITH